MTTVVQTRVDETLKNEASEIFESLGLDLPTAIRMFLAKSVMVGGIPFTVTLGGGMSPQERGLTALAQMRASSAANGNDALTDEDIEAEIAAVREARR